MLDFKQADKKLVNLIYAALDNGIESIKNGGPLIPFAITETNGGINFHKFAPKDFSDMAKTIQKAEAYLHTLSPSPDFFVLSFEGIVTLEGERSDAIMAKGFDKKQPQGYILAQRYKPKSFLKKAKAIGNAAYLGNEDKPLGK